MISQSEFWRFLLLKEWCCFKNFKNNWVIQYAKFTQSTANRHKHISFGFALMLHTPFISHYTSVMVREWYSNTSSCVLIDWNTLIKCTTSTVCINSSFTGWNIAVIVDHLLCSHAKLKFCMCYVQTHYYTVSWLKAMLCHRPYLTHCTVWPKIYYFLWGH